MPASDARLERVAEQIAERLPQQHVVAIDRAELAANRRARRRAPARPRGCRRRRARRSPPCRPCASVSSVGLAKFRKLVTISPSASVSCADARDVRTVVLRQALEIEQPGVAVNRRQAVAELVRDARGQLAEPRQAVLQPQLLFELHDLAEIGEQADRARRRARLRRESARPSRRGAWRLRARRPDRAPHDRLGFARGTRRSPPRARGAPPAPRRTAAVQSAPAVRAAAARRIQRADDARRSRRRAGRR